jgi:hypothetical protein
MPARTYPWEQYADVVDLLVDQLGATVALTGDMHERELVDRICGRICLEHRQSVLPLAGELEFGAFCALIEAADLTVTNNTGPMHISAAVKTPVIALFALTNPPEQWHPWQVPHRLLFHEVPCRLCYSRVCPYGQECLRMVSPTQVLQAALELLEDDGGLLEQEVGGERPRVWVRPQVERDAATEIGDWSSAIEPTQSPISHLQSPPESFVGDWKLGRGWKIGVQPDSEEAGWRLGAGWHLGSESSASGSKPATSWRCGWTTSATA